MFRKIGISLLIAFTMLVSTFNVTAIYATAPCATWAECRELQQETRDNIAEIIEEEEELINYTLELQAGISDLRDEIDELEERVNILESETADLAVELANLAEEIEENLIVFAEIEDRIADLIDEISGRMRIAQRVNNTNSFLTVLSESENIADFVRRARTFNRFAIEDAESMDELVHLIDAQEELLLVLEQQRDQFQERTDHLEALRYELEIDQENLQEEQVALVEREAEMQDRLYELNVNLLEEEELLENILEVEEILARAPPPPTMTSSNLASLQTPNESGLAHPLPGASVTSEFGPRWGSHHAGIDVQIFSQPSAPILAAASGTVIFSQFNNSMGWYVVISHNINGQRVDTLYGHLRYQPPVSAGDVVAQGQRIGTKGSTGFSTGAHLHFEVHPGGFSWNAGVNPREWINF